MDKHYTISANNIFVVNSSTNVVYVYFWLRFFLSFLEHYGTHQIFWIFGCQTLKGGWLFLVTIQF